MADDNKPLKYARYAIGEIALVVIGILIALQINNWNEDQKNNNEINSILKQIRSELLTSINDADDLLKFYMKKDSLIYLVMTNKVSYDDYKNGKIRGLSQLTTNYDIFTIQNDGYLNLMNHIKNSPKGLDSIISDLKHLYVNDLVFVEKANGFIEKIVDENNKWRKDNSSFYSQDYFRQEKISDEKIEFLLNSSYYKNEVYDYYGIVFFNQYPAIRTFRNGAYNTYKKITSYLNLDDDVILNPNPFHQEIDTYRNYLGNFTNKIDTVMISSENNEFIFESSYQLPETIIAVDTTSFMTSLNYFNYLKFDKQGNVIGLTMRVGDTFIEYSKME